MNDTSVIPDFDKLQRDIMQRLERELPPELSYHNAAHTRAVTAAAETLAAGENIRDEDRLLLLTAALLHDAGFLNAYKDHEQASCELARKELPAYGFSQRQVERVCRLIMATKWPVNPQDILERVLCDADLSYLGTESYHGTANRLLEELKRHGVSHSRTQWQHKQVLFLGAHRFYTNAAQQRFGATKAENLRALEEGLHQARHRESQLSDVFFMVLGALVAGFGLKGFLMPNLFFDGGVTGFSLLIHEIYHFNLAYVIVAMNLPLIAAGYFSIGKTFAFKTLAAVMLLGLCLLFVPYPVIHADRVLIAIFGGVFLGLGIGLTMRAGCALDGIEVLALYTLKRTSFTITEIILGINIIIFVLAAFKFGIPTALFSILTYFAASRMIDYVIEGIQAYTGVTIISGENSIIKHRLVNELGRGITVYKGERGFLPGHFDVSSDCDIIFTVVTRMELRKLKNLVHEIDPGAFVFASAIREAMGGILKRRSAH